MDKYFICRILCLNVNLCCLREIFVTVTNPIIGYILLDEIMFCLGSSLLNKETVFLYFFFMKSITDHDCFEEVLAFYSEI